MISETTTKWLIGGAVAVAAITAFSFWPNAAKAADLGGNCCSDLEERIAELEATTARKGNRKMSLTISGQVSQSILWVRSEDETAHGIMDNFNSPSRVTVSGNGKAGNGWTAGFLIELGIGDPGSQGVTVLRKLDGEESVRFEGETATSGISIRHSAAWVGTPAGKFWLGRTSTASDGIIEINLANVNVAALPVGSWSGFDGSRTQVLKYVSPAMAGFEISASLNDSLTSNTSPWDVALRYAGEFGGIRVAAGIAHADDGADMTRLSGSASVMHPVTGLFISGHAGEINVGNIDSRLYGGTAGIERNWFGIGRTTLFAEYSRITNPAFLISVMEFEVSGVDRLTVMGFGIVQSIDALASDLFVDYRQYKGDAGDESGTVETVMGGLRVKF